MQSPFLVGRQFEVHTCLLFVCVWIGYICSRRESIIVLFMLFISTKSS